MSRLGRLTTVAMIMGMIVAVMAGAATAGPDHPEPFEDHPHMLVLDVEFNEDGLPISAGGCVDLANNKSLTQKAHHLHVHFGQAGVALENGDNFIVPGAPFGEPLFPAVPWSDCESLLAFFGL